MVKMTEITEKGSGFLSGDSFTVKMELRIRRSENEVVSACVAGRSCTLLVRLVSSSRFDSCLVENKRH